MMVTPESSTYKQTADNSTPQERVSYWNAAQGLQAVDGLTTSPYLKEVANGHIEGRYDSSQAVEMIQGYYEEKASHAEGDSAKEADIVASRIVELLTKSSFTYRPSMLKTIHGELFKGLIEPPYDYSFRDYNIVKSETVLAGETVSYAPHDFLQDDLEYDFREFDYRSFTISPSEPGEGIAKLERFVSNVWQAHPFIEGNTRTTAVFVQLLLRSKGADVDNMMFAKHSLYFRNALVRANYSSIKDGIREDHAYITRFFENLLLGAGHDLRNRDLYCDALFENKGLELPSRAFAVHGAKKQSESLKSPSVALSRAKMISRGIGSNTPSKGGRKI